MEGKNSNFWVGLGVGSVFGMLIYRFCCSEKAKQLKERVTNAVQSVGNHAHEVMDSMKEKALDAGTNVADKVADSTFSVAEKADDMKNKVHNMADEAKVKY